MWIYAIIPFLLQAAAIGVDEIYFHYKRGLPRWERIGHPLDTLSLLACLAIVLFVPFTMDALYVYVGFSVLSCLMVTKDEFVHKHHCPWAENWLHALLFILHPIVLAIAGLIWPVISGTTAPDWAMAFLDDRAALQLFLSAQTLLIVLFFLYQVIFWNLIWKPGTSHD